MSDVTVEVRAEQRFEDWRDGEVRTVPRTRRIETLIAAGRLTVIEDIAVVEAAVQEATERSRVAVDALTEARAEADRQLAELPTETPPPRGRRKE